MTTYSDTPEDAMVNRLIRSHKENVGDGELKMDNVQVEPEAHYNHYGTRGVADLFAEEREEVPDHQSRRRGRSRTQRYSYVYEIKSEYAVREASGANEIIRQFNKTCEYFFKDESRTRGATVRFELCFLPTPVTWQHVTENYEMYESLVDGDTEETRDVCFRVPDESHISPVAPFRTSFDTMEEALEGFRPDFREHVEL